jgi:hypothetical protein
MYVRLLLMPLAAAQAARQVNNAVHFKGNTSRQIK